MDKQLALEARTQQKSIKENSNYTRVEKQTRELAITQSQIDYCNNILHTMGPYYTSKFWGSS